MFRVTFMCRDSQLGPCLNVLFGKTVGKPDYQPVANAKEENGQVKAVVASGSTIEKLANFYRENPPEQERISATDVRPILPKLGLAEGSYSYVMKSATEAGLFKKRGTGKGTYYLLNPAFLANGHAR